MFGSGARVMYTAVFSCVLSRGVCSLGFHHTPQIIFHIVVLKVLKIEREHIAMLYVFAVSIRHLRQINVCVI